MGCDIHSFAEVRKDGRWTVQGDIFPLDEFAREWKKKTHGSEPFTWRQYGLFGFLAGVRNYSAIRPMANPKGLPSDPSPEVSKEADEWGIDGHSHSWLTLAELLSTDYEAEVWDRRCTRQLGPNSWDGGSTAGLDEPHLGERLTLREFLGERYFADLEVLKSLGSPEDVRIVFWFDN